jgi:hypothetical protein
MVAGGTDRCGRRSLLAPIRISNCLTPLSRRPPAFSMWLCDWRGKGSPVFFHRDSGWHAGQPPFWKIIVMYFLCWSLREPSYLYENHRVTSQSALPCVFTPLLPMLRVACGGFAAPRCDRERGSTHGVPRLGVGYFPFPLMAGGGCQGLPSPSGPVRGTPWTGVFTKPSGYKQFGAE